MKIMLLDSNYCLRPSCYMCKARRVRHSDITIADFWGIESVAPEMNDEKGISCVMVRTKKGQDAFQKIEHKIQKKEVLYKDAVKGNSAEYQSPIKPPQRDTFFPDMNTLRFPELERKYASASAIPLKRKIKHLVKKLFLVRLLVGFLGIRL